MTMQATQYAHVQAPVCYGIIAAARLDSNDKCLLAAGGDSCANGKPNRGEHVLPRPIIWITCQLPFNYPTRAQAAKPSKGSMPLVCHFFPAHNATVLLVQVLQHLAWAEDLSFDQVEHGWVLNGLQTAASVFYIGKLHNCALPMLRNKIPILALITCRVVVSMML